MKPNRILEPKQPNDLDASLNGQWESLFVLLFYAGWEESSIELKKSMENYFRTFTTDALLVFLNVDSPVSKALVALHQIDSVPTVVCSNWKKETLMKDTTGVPPSIFQQIEIQIQRHKNTMESDKLEAFSKIEEILKRNRLVAFVNGASDDLESGSPSKKLMELFKEHSIHCSFKETSSDPSLEKWIKVRSGVNSIPQVFYNGEFIGEFAKIKEELGGKGLKERLSHECLVPSASNKLDALLKEARVVVFIRGTRENPEPEASCSLVKALTEKSVSFNLFEIEGDSSIPKALYEKFPVLSEAVPAPIIFIDQELFGCGYCLHERVFKEKVIPKECFRGDPVLEAIKKELQTDSVVVFIKGTPENPECCSTGKILRLLKENTAHFHYVNATASAEFKQKLVDFSGLKTFPQVFVKGELIGGFDSVKQMVEAGEWEHLVME